MTDMPPLAQRHFGTVFERALAAYPHKTAIRDPERALSYAQLYEEGMRAAGGLSRLGVERQKAVLLMLDNHVDFVVLWCGLSLTARIEVPINTAYRANLLAHIIDNSAAKVLVIEAGYLDRLVEVEASLTALETVVVRGHSDVTLPARWKRLAWEALSAGEPDGPATLHPADVMAILYTSGTTGPSKGSVNTHGHGYTYAHPSNFGAAGLDDVALVPLPLFHMGGQWAAVYNAFIGGATAVVLPKFSASLFWQQAAQYGATYAFLLGTMTHFLLKQPASPHDRAHALKSMLLVPVPAEIDDFTQRFGVDRIAAAFGSTEAGVIAHAPLGRGRAGAAGWVRDGIETLIVDAQGLEVAPGEVGELWARAKEPWTMMSGYHAMPEATVAAWQNMYFHTGDAVRQAEDGQLVFVDRVKDAIRRRGENVSSFEVEREINAHPDVAESAVIAVPSEFVEDEIKACVVLRERCDLQPHQLHSFLEPRLPRFALPRYIEILSQLPKTPTEKVRKTELRTAGVTPATWDRERHAARP
ncbi:AMP-binding protein [Variovorax sp. KK3]|uniref:AMP-binding protein n=1 Tax=Variovorax sp. KK3 TaxID=1855728 RepID=UPI00097BC97C|nr:AMP-binding protein [Variovorax sp. KK3]